MALIISIIINYLFNYYWTFSDKKKQNSNIMRGLVKYIAVSAPLDTIYMVIAGLLDKYTEYGLYLDYLINTAIGIFVIMIIRYMLVKKIVWATSFKE